MRSRTWLALIPLAAGAAAYWPVTRTFFHADDFQLLYAAADGRIWEFLITPHAGHLLVARNAVFLLHSWLFGVDPQGYYGTAYVTHLVNVGLLFAVIRRATDSARLACFGATLWAVSPLNAGALGWYAVYGQVLLTSCLLGALLCLLRLDDGAAVGRRAGLLAAALVLLGALSFGIGIGIALALAVAIGLLLPGPAQRGTRLWFRLLPLALPLLYVGLQVGYALVAGHRHETANIALSAHQVLLDVPVLTAYLAAYGTAVLVGGGPALGLSERVLLLAGGAAIAAVAASALLGPRRGPTGRRLAACALIVLGAYGIVALGRVPLLTTLGATRAQGATWARYHYTATAVIALALALALSRVRLPGAASAALVASLAAIAVATVRWPPPVDEHADERAAVARIRALVAERTAAGASTAYVHNRNLYPLNYIVDRRVFPGWAGLFVIFFPANVVGGVPVRFIDADPDVVAAARARPGTRMADLLVTLPEFRAATGQPPPRRVPAR